MSHLKSMENIGGITHTFEHRQTHKNCDVFSNIKNGSLIINFKLNFNSTFVFCTRQIRHILLSLIFKCANLLRNSKI